jgi:hypothetical protein
MRAARLSLCLVVLLAAIGTLHRAAPAVQAQATSSQSTQKLDAALVAKINQSLPGTPIEVIVAFSDLSAAPRVQALSTT